MDFLSLLREQWKYQLSLLFGNSLVILLSVLPNGKHKNFLTYSKFDGIDSS